MKLKIHPDTKDFIKNTIIVFFICFFTAPVIALVHETGHIIAAIMNGIEVIEMQIDLNSIFIIFNLFSKEPYGGVLVKIPEDLSDISKLMFYASGSISTLVLGLVLILIARLLYTHFTLSVAFIAQGLVFISDIIYRIFINVLIERSGEWYIVFEISNVFVALFGGSFAIIKELVLSVFKKTSIYYAYDGSIVLLGIQIEEKVNIVFNI